MVVSAGDQTFDQLDTLQTDIDNVEGELSTLKSDGDTLAQDSEWKGPDANAWKEYWDDTAKPHLDDTIEALRELRDLALQSANAIT
jgi:hypothetical protein